MGRYNHSLSLHAIIMVSKTCPIIGKHIGIIFVIWPAKNTLKYGFRGLLIKKRGGEIYLIKSNFDKHDEMQLLEKF